ncbi:MAG: ATP-binding protein [Phaeospirillum sp.]|nr:ATP-binding protein [Phaeospirillum sp.]
MKYRPNNRRLLIGLLGALLPALWGFIGYWSWSQHQGVIASSTILLEQITSAAEEQTTRLFKHAETSLVVAKHWMADHPDQDPGQDPSFIALIDELRLLSSGLLDIRMVSKSGGLFYIPKRGAKPLADVSDRDYFKAQTNKKTRGFFIADPVISRVTSRWGIPVSIPIERSGGDIGVLFAAMELDRIAKTFEAERIKPDGAISIMRDDGTFLFRIPAGHNIIGRSIAGTDSWDKHISLALRGVYRSDGSAVGTPAKLVSFARLRDYPLYVTVTAEVDAILDPWRRETIILTSITALITVVSLLLASWLLRAMKAEELAQQETRRAHRDAQMILDAAGEGICGVDSAGKVSFINPAACRMLEWKEADLTGQAIHPAIHHSHPDGSAYPDEQCPISMTVKDGVTREVTDETFWRSTGASFPVEFVVSGVVEDNCVTGAVLVFRDVSERLNVERALITQAAELARSNSELEQFAYVASHDLREPLRQVSSYVSLLERRYGAKLDEDGLQFVHFARDGAKRMNQLIIDLLEFSRIGHHTAPAKAVSLVSAVDQAVANLSNAIADAKAVIHRDNDLPSVMAVRDDLVRLFQNLISNALKYCDQSQIPTVTISARREAEEWIISIADNGIGIDPQYGEKIFGIFQRLHTRDKFEGTGIGLAICKKIVEQMGGRIWVESTAGQGSRFHIALPARIA